MPETTPETTRATRRGLSLLGGWQLVVDGETVVLGGREQRLCALLALTGTRARAQVAGTLWPESTDARALASLRRAVAQTHQRCPGLLSADRTSVGLAPDVATDVDELRAAVSRAGAPDADAAVLAALVGEELLPGWYDEWAEAQRETLQQQQVAALEQLARHALDRGDTALAEDAARAVARIEPLREPASELLIRTLLARDDRAGAVRELERYREVVGAELGVAPSPALVALVETATTPRVPVQRRAPLQETARTPEPLPPPAPLSPTGPAGLSARAAAARLAVGAALVMAASLAIANLGPDSAQPAQPSVADGRSEQAVPTDDRRRDTRQVQVRPVAAAGGAAAFVVRATLRPARVRLEVASRSGDSVVRSVVVRSRDGQRLVVGGLDGGTYRWSATSPTAAPVTGEVRVDEQEPPPVVAAAEPSREPTPTTPAPTSSAPTTSTPTLGSLFTEAPSPTPQPTPTVAPHPQPSPTQPGPTQPGPTPPGPTRHPDPPSQPTDPGTQDPGLVG
ncbi:AfsR/SARP family transcriptional regulator [Nocardia sp. N13]|uniref:AfsR/SARP family transcriptional regulator n=1 Tax=Nocardioides sp. N13(2025) TaxID=3453405 RepID=UPI003F7771B8